MTQAIVGSYADTLLKKGAAIGREEVEATSEILYFIKMLCKLFKKYPEYTDADVTNFVECPAKMTKELRSLLTKNEEKKAKEQVLQKYFQSLTLTEKQQKQLFKSIAEYYKEEK